MYTVQHIVRSKFLRITIDLRVKIFYLFYYINYQLHRLLNTLHYKNLLTWFIMGKRIAILPLILDDACNLRFFLLHKNLSVKFLLKQILDNFIME